MRMPRRAVRPTPAAHLRTSKTARRLAATFARLVAGSSQASDGVNTAAREANSGGSRRARRCLAEPRHTLCGSHRVALAGVAPLLHFPLGAPLAARCCGASRHVESCSRRTVTTNRQSTLSLFVGFL